MVRPVGIETEYGMNCQLGFSGDVDFGFEASTIVRAADWEPSFRGWDYSNEDARLDMRGDRAKALARDPNDLRDSRANSSHLLAMRDDTINRDFFYDLDDLRLATTGERSGADHAAAGDDPRSNKLPSAQRSKLAHTYPPI